jgi:hypothetical protein
VKPNQARITATTKAIVDVPLFMGLIPSVPIEPAPLINSLQPPLRPGNR